MGLERPLLGICRYSQERYKPAVAVVEFGLKVARNKAGGSGG